MITYECRTGCARKSADDAPVIAQAVIGVRWWAPPDPPDSHAEVLSFLWRRGHCERHAALLADIVMAAVRDEGRRRCSLPGTVEVREVGIHREPFEAMADAVAKRGGAPIVDRVRKFVHGSSLSALVEVDVRHKRARVTLRLPSGEGQPPETVLESTRLVHVSAVELADALRRRAR